MDLEKDDAYLRDEDARLLDPKGVTGVVASPHNAQTQWTPSFQYPHRLPHKALGNEDGS